MRAATLTESPKTSPFCASIAGAAMDADAKARCAGCCSCSELVHPQLDLARGVHRLVGGREDDHRLVADRLDEAPAMPGRRVADERQALVDRGQRLRVAQLLVEPRASRDIGEQHGQRLLGGAHR